MASTARDWYVLKSDSTPEGPYTEVEIAQRIEDKRLVADSMVWRSGWAEWRRLADVDESPEQPAAGTAGALDMSNAPGRTSDVPRESSLALFLGAFAYPIRGNGKTMLLIGSIFVALLRIKTPLLAGVYVTGAKTIISAFAAAFTLSFMFKIIRTSAVGQSAVPDWPKVSGAGADISWPVPIMVKITLIAWGLPIALVVAGLYFEMQWLMLLAIPFAVLGAFYLPMAILNGAMGGQEYLRPDKIVKDCLRIFRSYALALIALLIVGVATTLGEIMAGWWGIPVISYFAGTLVSFYFTMVEMRILGLIYWTHGDKLDWEVVL